MGNVQVKYKAMRGSHEVGETITDPHDWFQELFANDREATMEMYNALSDDQKEQLNNCFDDGDADVFRNQGASSAWIGE